MPLALVRKWKQPTQRIDRLPVTPTQEHDGYEAAVINYGYLANAVVTTDDAVKGME
jgi:hypothetical protein